ncbi:hypothetical protein ATE84_0575 [Aquimarina sp. MAR_2010_214]|nr:hypothetical protein [Aquimarina sp. MAR_2010_214]PKV48575.1 hypothetical protein ATE84_0575 [Aquimarina sp. MAR_2010_214]
MKTIRLLFLTPLDSFIARQQKEPPDSSEHKKQYMIGKMMNPEIAFG